MVKPNKHSKEFIVNKITELHPDLKFNIDTYNRAADRILVETKYGVCSSQIKCLLRGYTPDIRVAIDKNEYFRNMVFDKFGEDIINNLSQINYIDNRNKIKVIDKDYGEYWITPYSFMAGARHKIRGFKKSSDSQRSDKQDIINSIKTLHPEISFEISEYKSVHDRILIKDEYGECKTTIRRLLMGQKPTISAALNPTEYYINQAKAVHGDKYDYSLVEYKSYDGKISIIGPNGIFKIRAASHLNGAGCLIETRQRITQRAIDVPPGWSSKNWAEAAKKSKNFTGLFKVYFIECWDNETGEKFYKIGRSFNTVKKRFPSKNILPYDYNIMYTLELEDPKRICELEQEYKNKHKEYKYIPKKEFRGMHECFSKIIYI